MTGVQTCALPIYKKFDDLCRFFNDWHHLVSINNSPIFAEFEYIKKLTWFYYNVSTASSDMNLRRRQRLAVCSGMPT